MRIIRRIQAVNSVDRTEPFSLERGIGITARKERVEPTSQILMPSFGAGDTTRSQVTS